MPESHKLGQVPDGSIDPTHENNYKVMNDLLKGAMILVRESLLCSEPRYLYNLPTDRFWSIDPR